jgi:hypothetical protein
VDTCFWYCTYNRYARESGSSLDHSLAPVLVAAVRYSIVKVVKCSVRHSIIRVTLLCLIFYLVFHVNSIACNARLPPDSLVESECGGNGDNWLVTS